MRFGILGATEVRYADEKVVTVGGPRVRALLVILLLNAGRAGHHGTADRRPVRRRPAGRRRQRPAVPGLPAAPRARRDRPGWSSSTRPDTGSPSTPATSTPTGSSGSAREGGGRWPPVTRRGPRRCCARRSGCGVGPRWPTWPARRSPRPRRPGWRSCASPPLEDRAEAELALGAHGDSSPSCASWSRRIPCGNACAASSCGRCTRAGGRPRRSRCSRRRGGCSPRSWAPTPPPELAAVHLSILRADRCSPETGARDPGARGTWAPRTADQLRRARRGAPADRQAARHRPPRHAARARWRRQDPAGRRGRRPGDGRGLLRRPGADLPGPEDDAARPVRSSRR